GRRSWVGGWRRWITSAAWLEMLRARLRVVPPVPICSVPALIVVVPVEVLVPVSVNVPVPTLVRLVAAAPPFWITPENVVDVLSPPVVSVLLLALPLVTVPAPASEPIVSLKLLRASVAPEAIVKALFCAKVFVAAACSVPALPLVAPG